MTRFREARELVNRPLSRMCTTRPMSGPELASVQGTPMPENATRAVSAQHLIDLSKIPRPSRSLLKRLTAYPSWLAEGWANPSDEHLREAAEYSDTRPIQRARKVLVELGLVEHREVRRGQLLPNGELARFRHWIYVVGPALRCPPSNDDGGGEPAGEERCEKGTVTVPKEHRYGAFLAPRSVDPEERSDRVRSSAPPEPHRLPLALESEGSTFSDLAEPTEMAAEPSTPVLEVATAVLAHEVARYFVAATGLGWKTIRNDVIDYLAPFLDGMNGDGPSRVARACRVIDSAVLEGGERKPTLRYVFHPQMYWKRLTALTDPQAKPLAKAPRRPVDASSSSEAPCPPATPRRPSTEPWPSERVDLETMRRTCEALNRDDLAALRALAGEGARMPAPPIPVETVEATATEIATTGEEAEFAELRELTRVRRAVLEREAKELELREEDAERQKRARWEAEAAAERAARPALEEGESDERPRITLGTGGSIKSPPHAKRSTGGEGSHAGDESEVFHHAEHEPRARRGPPPRAAPRRIAA